MAELKTIANEIKTNQAPSNDEDMQPPEMSKARILKNLIVVCLGILFLYSAHQGLANLQSTLNMEEDIGVVSQSVMFSAFMVSSLLLPKLVIKQLGCKLTIVLSILTYAPYVAANFYLHLGTFVPTAMLLGFGGAPLWSAKCTYINKISAMYATHSPDSVDVVTSKFFGIFFMAYQNTQIWGNLVSFFVLRPPRKAAADSDVEYSSVGHASGLYSFLSNDTSSNVTCGVNFFDQPNENLEPPPDSERYMLLGLYLACVLIAAVVVAMFLDPLKREAEQAGSESVRSMVMATLKHTKKPLQLLMIPLTVFSGIEHAFIIGDYTKAYVACAWGLHTVGFVFIFFGVVNAVMSVVAGRIVKYISRKVVMVVGASGNVGVCVALFVWDPVDSELVYAFVIVGVWALSDAIWQTQVYALYGALFRSQEEAGFANYVLWESLGFALAYGYSSVLNVAAKMYILLGFLVTGMIGYFAAEMSTAKRNIYTVNSLS